MAKTTEHVLKISVEAPSELTAEEVAKLIDKCIQIGVSDASDTLVLARREGDEPDEDAGDIENANKVVMLAIDDAEVISSTPDGVQTE